ncbi:hypothetical protein ACJX0J_037520, partial [Zea mays]
SDSPITAQPSVTDKDDRSTSVRLDETYTIFLKTYLHGDLNNNLVLQNSKKIKLRTRALSWFYISSLDYCSMKQYLKHVVYYFWLKSSSLSEQEAACGVGSGGESHFQVEILSH